MQKQGIQLEEGAELKKGEICFNIFNIRPLLPQDRTYDFPTSEMYRLDISYHMSTGRPNGPYLPNPKQYYIVNIDRAWKLAEIGNKQFTFLGGVDLDPLLSFVRDEAARRIEEDPYNF